MLAGPSAEDGSSDTYILRDGSDKFEPYEKRSSDDRVYSQAGCTYRGRLFVIGSAWFEPEKRLFRATAMEVPEYPGDIPCDDGGGVQPDDSGGSHGKTGTGSVKTGDDAQLALYLILASAALSMLAALSAVRIRRRRSE